MQLLLTEQCSCVLSTHFMVIPTFARMTLRKRQEGQLGKEDSDASINPLFFHTCIFMSTMFSFSKRTSTCILRRYLRWRFPDLWRIRRNEKWDQCWIWFVFVVSVRCYLLPRLPRQQSCLAMTGEKMAGSWNVESNKYDGIYCKI